MDGDPTASGFAAECSTCHGGSDGPAPPRSTTGANSTADPGVGAHATHLRDGALSRAVACDECHVVPRSIGDAGHMDGKVDLTFGPLASAAGTPRWDPSAGTCAVYCHGATLAGGSVAAPLWTKVDGTQAACGSCHGLPPPAPHPQATACATCHPDTVRPDGSIDVARGAHIDGKVEVATNLACGSCHGIPPPAPHVQSTLCGSCHPGYTSTSVNAATHMNGTIDVSSQACGTCHAIPPATGQHATHVSGEHLGCGTCHAGFTATSAGPTHLNGTVDVSAPGWNAASQTCANSCHGTHSWFGGG